MATRKTAAQKQQAKERAREYLKPIKPGDTIYCVLRSVSSSGMSRQISVYHASYDRKNKRVSMWNITELAANLLGYRVGSNGGVVMGGCGMDTGFALVYELGNALFPKGFKVKGEDRRESGGYALKKCWL